MSLSGRLEDLQLRDLLQIINASRNSGLLQLKNGHGLAELLFREGQVVSAWRQSEQQPDSATATRSEFLRQSVCELVSELLGWQAGNFIFQAGPLTEASDRFASGVHLCLEEGLQLNELLDEAPVGLPAADTAAATPPGTANNRARNLAAGDPIDLSATVLIVDDDARIGGQLVEELARQGHKAQAFISTKELLERARCYWREGLGPLLIIDLIIPRLHGGGLLGGLELVELAQGEYAEGHCLVYSDYPCPEVEQQLQRLGVEKLLFKPRSVLGPENGFSSEVDDFCRQLALQASGLLAEFEPAKSEPAECEPAECEPAECEPAECEPAECEPAECVVPSTGAATEPPQDKQNAERFEPPSRTGLELLKGLLQELQRAESADQVMLLVLRFAAEVFGRAVLFSVGTECIVGLGQFGHGGGDVSADEKVRRIVIPLAEKSSFQEAIELFAVKCGPLGSGQWDSYLRQQLGLGPDDEVFIGPLVNEGRVVALLCGDSLPANGGVADQKVLEIFLQQAGGALERLQMTSNLRNLSGLLEKTFC